MELEPPAFLEVPASVFSKLHVSLGKIGEKLLLILGVDLRVVKTRLFKRRHAKAAETRSGAVTCQQLDSVTGRL